MGTTEDYSNCNNKGQKYYIDVSATQINKDSLNELSEKIQIKVSINQINVNCSYQIQSFNLIGLQKFPLNENSKCTIIDKNIAQLNSPIIIKYIFEKEQNIMINIIKTEHGIPKQYEVKTTLGCIMGSRKNTHHKKISPSENEILVLQGEKLIKNQKIVYFKFTAISNQPIQFNDMINKFYYEIFSEDKILYKSELIDDKGKFSPVKIPAGLFKNDNIRIMFYKYNNKEKGNYNLNIFSLENYKKYDILINKIPIQIISKSRLKNDYTFVDYLKAGMQIGLSVAIDFTSSNKNPNDSNSLHYIHGQDKNQYERAILACGYILAYYDYDQLFPCFGFGAKYKEQTLQVFNLNLKNDPNINFIQGIIEAYHEALRVLTLWGPTYFAPIIRNMNKLIKNENVKYKYHILMILTDGMIDDMDDTIEELVESSFLPLSVIIIGVGQADFSCMVELDADEKPLINSKGIQAERDLVQFVPFLKYESNPELLANEVLAEIPRQIIEYYEKNNIDP